MRKLVLLSILFVLFLFINASGRIMFRNSGSLSWKTCCWHIWSKEDYEKACRIMVNEGICKCFDACKIDIKCVGPACDYRCCWHRGATGRCWCIMDIKCNNYVCNSYKASSFTPIYKSYGYLSHRNYYRSPRYFWLALTRNYTNNYFWRKTSLFYWR